MKQEIIEQLKEIKEKVDNTIPFSAEDRTDELVQLFKLRLKINEECLTNDKQVMTAFDVVHMAFYNMVEYHASNFAQLP